MGAMTPQNVIRAPRRHEHRKDVSPDTGAQLSLDALGLVPVDFEPYDIPAPRHLRLEPPSVGRDTSEAAAERIKPHAAIQRQRIFDMLKTCAEFGATDQELQAALVIDASSERPRRGELVAMGVVRDSGKRRQTRAGRDAIVWVVGDQQGSVP